MLFLETIATGEVEELKPPPRASIQQKKVSKIQEALEQTLVIKRQLTKEETAKDKKPVDSEFHDWVIINPQGDQTKSILCNHCANDSIYIFSSSISRALGRESEKN